MLSRKATLLQMNGYRLLIVDREVPSFAFGRSVVISQTDYDAHGPTILSHEQAHVRLNHFADLLLLELVRTIHWFNPAVYALIGDMKEIHEFQADQQTLHSGIDAKQYQILIIQKGVGPRRFALANSFNHCQIKKRIIMMNKSKTSKAWHWKVATFLPLLALLLMAFGKPGENVADRPILQNGKIAAAEITTPTPATGDRVVQIKADGNYIGNKRCTLDEISKNMEGWSKASNKWILLQAEKATPVNRIDEILDKISGTPASYHITISLGTPEIIYSAWDVSTIAKFQDKNWTQWIRDQLSSYSNGKSDQVDFTIKYRFIIDKTGKVSSARIVRNSQSDEINAAMEKVLSQIPDWIPARRGGEAVGVLYDETWFKKKNENRIRLSIPPPPPINDNATTESKDLPPYTNMSQYIPSEMIPTPQPKPKIKISESVLLIEFTQDGNYINDQFYSQENFIKKVKEWKSAAKSISFVSPTFELSDSRNIELTTISNATGIPFVPNLGVDQQAVFPGGTSGMFTWIKQNIKYPMHDAAFSWSKNTIVEFTVNSKGKAVAAKIVKAISPELDREALRIIDQMPVWKPAIKNGIPVNVIRRLSIPFK